MATPIGLVPADGEINTEGLAVSEEAMHELLDVDADAVRAQLPQLEEHLARFGDDLPDEVRAQARGAEGAAGLSQSS